MRTPWASPLAALFCGASLATAGTIPVTNTNDNLAGSLRQAIQDANPGDTIVFNIPVTDPRYDAASRTWTILLTSAELLISRDLTIQAGNARIRVQRNGPIDSGAEFRVLHVSAGTVTISGLTIANGFSRSLRGTGVFNRGNLTLSECTISDNGSFASGGGIANEGSLTLLNCTVARNRTRTSGSGIHNTGTLAVRNCTISQNREPGVCAAAYGIANSGEARVRNTVIAANGTCGDPNTRDVSGAFISEGYNFIGINYQGSGFGQPGSRDQTGTFEAPADPKLGALADNGGRVFTMLPQSGSTLIDQAGTGTNSDARGFRRPLDNPAIPNAVEGDGSDIGAVEVEVAQGGPNFVVNTNDEHSDGVCGLGDCSLWDAVNASNANVANNSVITFAPEAYGVIPVTLQAAGMNVTRPVTISGPGAGVLQLSASLRGRHFNVSAQNVVISGLTLSTGSFGGTGGSILNSGGLTLQDCSLLLNSTFFSGNIGAQGGAIYNQGGTLSLIRCSLIGNRAEGAFSGGGALLNNRGSVTLDRCTFSDNRSGAGGAIRVLGTTGNAALTATNCTFGSNSTAEGSGGAIANLSGGGFTSALTLTNCTFSGNEATNGGAIHTHRNPDGGPARVTLRNTILQTGARGANLVTSTGTFVSEGHNLSNDAAGGFLTASGDKPNTDPRLDTLKLNGGETATFALLSESPAIDAGNDAFAPPQDQRGFPRFGVSDIGAFEVQPPPPPSPTPSRFVNISTRMRVETGDNVLIGGFIVTGSAQKRIIVRALGPSLQSIAPEEQLANPVLELYRGNELLASNDNWQEAPNRQEIIDSTIPPSHDLESAILRNVDPGAHTAVVRGVGGGQGVGLIEVYDLGSSQDSKLANIATRGRVLTGDNVMIGGLIITGSSAQRVIVRAIGPSLPVEGRLEDPLLQLFDGNGNPITSNDNWKETQQAEIEATTIPPSNDFESAIVATLTPAPYTAIVRGVNDTTGVAVVEVYALQ